MKKELITIVIPVYKVEKYIDRCIKSVINQTYKNLEIILVDDGSPDNCPKICDEYAEKDKRIKVIHKKNGGLSDARNVGIEAAKGKYISFIDSDDWIEKDFIECLYKSIKKNIFASVKEKNSDDLCYNILEIEIRVTKLYSLLTNDENLVIKEYQLPIRKDL